MRYLYLVLTMMVSTVLGLLNSPEPGALKWGKHLAEWGTPMQLLPKIDKIEDLNEFLNNYEIPDNLIKLW